MISKTTLKSRIRSKTSPAIKDIISLAMKEKSWTSLAQILSGSTNRHSSVNLSVISRDANESIVVVPGKVLGSGSIDKKVAIYALSFSSSASEKLNKAKVPYGSIAELIGKNPKATGVQILR